MTAEPVPEYYPSIPANDVDYPSQILRMLPREYHERFLAEYQRALVRARDVEWYPNLVGFLRFWRLRALAYSDPAYADGLQATQESLRTGNLEGWTSLDEILARHKEPR